MNGKTSIAEISVDELIKIIQDAAKTATEEYATDKIEKAVKESLRTEAGGLLTKFGIDIKEPLVMQGRMIFLDKQMKGSEQLQSLVKKSAVGVFIGAALWAMWIGIISKIKTGS